MLVDRLNDTGEWFAQRAPSSKGVDVIAQSKKHARTIFIECKNTDQEEFRIGREELEALMKRAYVAGAQPFLAIHWRGRKNEKDKRRKWLSFYPSELLASKLDSAESKTLSFKPYDWHRTFEEIFT
jgi:Holliday junction resolvase